MDLMESSRPIDIITLVEELERKRELQAIGDVGYISGLLDGVPDRPSIEHYIHIVRDKAVLRGLINVSTKTIAHASEQSDPADEILNEAEAAIFDLSEKRIGRGFMGIPEIVREKFGSVDALLQRGQRVTGLATHYTDLDEMTSGLQKSDLIILAARPSMGKTAFAMNIAENAAIEDKQVVAIFSLEMSSEALLQRLLCSRARVDSHKLRTGSLWRDDMSSAEEHSRELTAILGGEPITTLPLVILVAEQADRMLVGFLEVDLRSHADGCNPSRPVGYIEGWYVAEDSRHQGIGRKLLAVAEDWARSQGCVEIASDTCPAY